ncbi:MAG: cell envelope integrity protein TolA [Gammaproteobacteria bacterium]|nr:cell envelope integrity protein TolA [Gammaproteobacteria bacterium]
MFDWIKENSTAFVIAVILHLVFFGALLFNWQMDKPKKIVLEQGDVIQVTSVDANTYDAEIQKIDQQKQAEQQLKAESQRKAKELKKKKRQEEQRRQQEKKHKSEELKQKKAAAAKKKEEQRKAALIKEKKLKEEERKKLKLKEAERKEAEKKAAEEKRQLEARLKEEERKKEQQEKQRLEEQKKQQEAERKRQAAEKKQQLAELKRKEQRDRLERERRSKGIVNRHVALIAQKIERSWRQPLGAPANLQCKIDIVLLPSGNVVSVKVVESSGNLSFDRSVETAVRKASPLPVPTDSVIFKEFEVMRLRFEPGSD